MKCCSTWLKFRTIVTLFYWGTAEKVGSLFIFFSGARKGIALRVIDSDLRERDNNELKILAIFSSKSFMTCRFAWPHECNFYIKMICELLSACFIYWLSPNYDRNQKLMISKIHVQKESLVDGEVYAFLQRSSHMTHFAQPTLKEALRATYLLFRRLPI